MKKGVIMDIKKGYAVVSFEGKFQRIVIKDGMEIGRTVIFTEEDIMKVKKDAKKRVWMKILPVAAAFVIIFALSINYYNNNMAAYSIVTVDINPSIELILNKNDDVIKVLPLNEDAESLQLNEIMGVEVEEAIHLIVQVAQESGFISDLDQSYVVVTTVPIKSDNDELNLKLKEELLVLIPEENIQILITESVEEVLNEAIEKGIPLSLMKFKDEIDIDEVDSVKEFFEDEDNKVLFESTVDFLKTDSDDEYEEHSDDEYEDHSDDENEEDSDDEDEDDSDDEDEEDSDDEYEEDSDDEYEEDSDDEYEDHSDDEYEDDSDDEDEDDSDDEYEEDSDDEYEDDSDDEYEEDSDDENEEDSDDEDEDDSDDEDEEEIEE